MKPKNTNLIDEIRSVIWITEKSKTNDKVNILKKSNQRTGIPIPKLKELLEKHTGKYWKVEDLEGSSTKLYTNTLIPNPPDDCIGLEGE
jgi:hypothetical protein